MPRQAYVEVAAMAPSTARPRWMWDSDSVISSLAVLRRWFALAPVKGRADPAQIMRRNMCWLDAPSRVGSGDACSAARLALATTYRTSRPGFNAAAHQLRLELDVLAQQLLEPPSHVRQRGRRPVSGRRFRALVLARRGRCMQRLVPQRCILCLQQLVLRR